MWLKISLTVSTEAARKSTLAGIIVPACTAGRYSRFPDNGEQVDQLVDAALLATREARQLRQSVRRFGSNAAASAKVQMDLETELLHALEAGQLCLYYQPRIDLQLDKSWPPRRSSAGSIRFEGGYRSRSFSI